MEVKVLVVVLAASVAYAVPKVANFNFRNLYKDPVVPASHTNPHIIGGQEATPHEFPYQAYLEIYNSSDGWYCSGSLISENYILTAGHCGVEALQVLIILGAHRPRNFESSQVQTYSNDIRVHPGFDLDEIVNDIAVLKIATPVPLSDVVKVVPLPGQSDTSKTYAGETAVASGWGLINGNDYMMSEVLNYVELAVITNEECEATFGELEESVLCTSGRDNTGTCNGDSGGPLTVGGVQVGVVSFGVVKCPAGYPDAFTRVTSFLDWIAENTDVVIV